jgi:hypothetical protein
MVGSNLAAGLAASMTVGGLQHLARWLMRDAPRMDVMGQRLLEKGFVRLGRQPPRSTRLLSWAVGNLGSDTVFFALVGAGDPKRPLVRGVWVGALAGAAAVLLPPLLGLSSRHTARTAKTAAATVGTYVAAGLAAAGALQASRRLSE